MTATFTVGHVFEELAKLEPNSVDLVLSSPPFLALRSYLPADHEHKSKEIGSEATPADFLDTLLDVVEACDRVLAPHGSLCFELGDTYAGPQPPFRYTEKHQWLDRGGAGGPMGGSHHSDGRGNEIMGEHNISGRVGSGWPLDKSLCGIPTLFAWSLAYGRNLLRPERETPRWRIRNLVVWARPNPPVGALGDKFRPATSYVTVATKARDRYFDLDAVRTSLAHDNYSLGQVQTKREFDRNGTIQGHERTTITHPAGAPPLDYWVIPTAPYKGSHYATFPPQLVVPLIKSMVPERVCRVCGVPSRRITEVERVPRPTSGPMRGGANRDPNRQGNSAGEDEANMLAIPCTLGWTDCGHDDWRPGLVLDPFAGSGTTGQVATGHGRDAILIDIDSRNLELARERIGMFLEEA